MYPASHQWAHEPAYNPLTSGCVYVCEECNIMFIYSFEVLCIHFVDRVKRGVLTLSAKYGAIEMTATVIIKTL